MGGANIGQAIGEGILAAARYMAGVGDFIIGGLTTVGEYLTFVGGNWSAVFDSVGRLGSLLAGVARVWAGSILTVLGTAAKVIGLVSKTAQDASKGITAAAKANFAAAGQNFDGAFGDKAKAGAGPLSVALGIALEKSRLAAGQLDQAKKTTIAGMAPAGGVIAARNQEVKAIDSRSKEGIAEMFRLMRGDANDPAERTAKATERIADNTDDMGIDIEELSFAG
jgi:hypothetical protein